MTRAHRLPPRALTDAVLRRCGLTREAFRMIGFIHEWALCEADLGERVGIERFGEWSPETTRTAYRRLEEYRRIFATDGTPSDALVWPHGQPERGAIDSDEVAWALVVA